MVALATVFWIDCFSLKKAKETIRSLRFQLSQAEEKLFSKSGGVPQQLPRGMTEDITQLRSKNEGMFNTRPVSSIN